MDICDRADAEIQLDSKRLIANALAKISHAKSEKYCIDCGKEIPRTRRTLVPGCTRCVECQLEFERRLRR